MRALAACNKFKEVHKFGKCQFDASAALWVFQLDYMSRSCMKSTSEELQITHQLVQF